MPLIKGQRWALAALVSAISMAHAEDYPPKNRAQMDNVPERTERGWYLGVLGGQASGEVTDDHMNRRMAREGYAVDAQVNDLDRTAFSVMAGYRWSPYVSLEAAYTDLGEVTTTLRGNASDVNDFLTSADRVHPASADGIEFSFHGRYPLTERLDLFGRMGVMLADSRYEANATTGEQENLSEDGQLHLEGIGLDYEVTEHWIVRASGTRYHFEDEKIDFLGVGVLYFFPEKPKPKKKAPVEIAPVEIAPVATVPTIPVVPVPPPSKPTPTLAEQLQSQGLATQQTDRGIMATLTGVVFAINSADLSESGKASVDKVAALMRAHPERSVVVEGHTDTQGRAAANQRLSERRAESVKQALIAAGVAADRIVARGYGHRYPVASNNDEAGRQLNRRVEFLFSAESGAPVPERTQ